MNGWHATPGPWRRITGADRSGCTWPESDPTPCRAGTAPRLTERRTGRPGNPAPAGRSPRPWKHAYARWGSSVARVDAARCASAAPVRQCSRSHRDTALSIDVFSAHGGGNVTVAGATPGPTAGPRRRQKSVSTVDRRPRSSGPKSTFDCTEPQCVARFCCEASGLVRMFGCTEIGWRRTSWRRWRRGRRARLVRIGRALGAGGVSDGPVAAGRARMADHHAALPRQPTQQEIAEKIGISQSASRRPPAATLWS